MSYTQLTIDEREVIMIEYRIGHKVTEIAEQLGRHKSTISRQIRRNNFKRGYSAHQSQERADKRRATRRNTPKLERYPELLAYVHEKLLKYWSPEQISWRLKKDFSAVHMQISHEAIYQFILRNLKEGHFDYSPYLRQRYARNKYKARGHKKYKRIRNPKRITERPPEVETRDHVGHWESDSVRGKGSRPDSLATHVERKTRFTVAAKLANKTADCYNLATIRAFKKKADLPLYSFTVDNGMEFAKFKVLEKLLDAPVFFAAPYHSWERGSNENLNGLLRQFFPKGMDLCNVTDKDVQNAVDLLNNRPRKCLNYRTPHEAMQEELVALAN